MFWKAVGNTALFTIVATIADVFGGLLLALACSPARRSHALLRIVWFTPVLMSYVVVGIIWVWIYDYDWGLANTILRAIGLGAFEQSWLGDPHTALWSVMATHVWKWLGFNMIIFLAALYALPGEVLGAAELDNCGWFAKLVYIIIPMLRPTIVNLLVLSFIGKMMVFDLVWIMTGGGPLWSTETVSTYVYKRAFDWNTFDLGYPSAIAVLWFLIILAFVVLMTQLLRQRDQAGVLMSASVAVTAPRLGCGWRISGVRRCWFLSCSTLSSPAAPSFGWRPCRCARRRKSLPAPTRCRRACISRNSSMPGRGPITAPIFGIAPSWWSRRSRC